MSPRRNNHKKKSSNAQQNMQHKVVPPSPLVLRRLIPGAPIEAKALRNGRGCLGTSPAGFGFLPVAKEATDANGALTKTLEWPMPKPIPDELLRVDHFASDFVPNRLAPWIDDVANRLQAPPDYVAVAAIETTGSIDYNRALIDFARRYGFLPKACRPYRAKTKGKVERPFDQHHGRPGRPPYGHLSDEPRGFTRRRLRADASRGQVMVGLDPIH